MEMMFHCYHMVTMSPWPLIMGFSVLTLMLGFIKMFMYLEYNLLFMSLMMITIISFLWWRDVMRESTFQGYHSGFVLNGLMVGMLLFIVSEIFFFFSFFWTFFHSSLSPTVDLGQMWPPFGIFPFNPFQIPLLNTVVLLTSGVSVTWCHQSILNKDWMMAKSSIMLTWMLGFYFLFLQGFEYYMALYSIADSVFGSIFFMATGFHGMHVLVGTLFLFIMWLRIMNMHFSSNHHFGFEASAWYWHFVDVVWLFLFSMMYWWGM